MPDPNTFMYIKPDYDDSAIEYLVLTEPIKEYAVSKGYNVVSLEGDDAKPESVFQAIQQHNPFIIFTSGHGCTHLTTSQEYMDLFYTPPGCEEHGVESANTLLLRDRISFILSCHSGKSLVPAIIADGGKASTGFADEFIWVVDAECPPIEDPFSLTFFDCPDYFMKQILDGISVEDAYLSTKERYNQLINSWGEWIGENLNAPPRTLARAYLTVSLLEHNRDVMTSIGQDFSYIGEKKETDPLLIIAAIALGLMLLA